MLARVVMKLVLGTWPKLTVTVCAAMKVTQLSLYRSYWTVPPALNVALDRLAETVNDWPTKIVVGDTNEGVIDGVLLPTVSVASQELLTGPALFLSPL
jgi:hypothetical protein